MWHPKNIIMWAFSIDFPLFSCNSLSNTATLLDGENCYFYKFIQTFYGFNLRNFEAASTEWESLSFSATVNKNRFVMKHHQFSTATTTTTTITTATVSSPLSSDEWFWSPSSYMVSDKPRFRTGHRQGPCRANLHKWGLAQSPSCECGQRQTMNHIVDTGQLTKFEGDWIYSTKRMMTQSYGWNLQRLQHSRNNNN